MKAITRDDQIVELAVRHLTEGHRTMYVTMRPQRMLSMMQRIADVVPNELVDRVYLGRGDERIQARNGAMLTFHAAENTGRGIAADALLLDGVPDQVHQDALLCVIGSSVAEVHSWP